MERRKEFLRIVAAFVIALSIGFWMSEKIQSDAIRPYIVDTPKQPHENSNHLPLENDADQGYEAESLGTPSPPTRPMKKAEPKALVSQIQKDLKKPVQEKAAQIKESEQDLEKNIPTKDPLAANSLTVPTTLPTTPPAELTAGDQALLYDKKEFSGNSKLDIRNDDDGEDFFETKYDIEALVQKNSISDGEKSFNENMARVLEAQRKINPEQNSLGDLNRYRVDQRETQRFGIKLQLPEQNDPMQLKLQYREAPNFGASAHVPELILPAVKSEPGFVEVERSKTSESPWNNFDSSSLNPF